MKNFTIDVNCLKEFDDRNCPSISNYTSDEKGFVRLYSDYCKVLQIVNEQFEEIQELLEKIHEREGETI